MARTGRNDRCPCDSGKKYKQCCALKHNQMSPLLLVVLVAGAILAVVVVTSVRQSSGSGRMWSAEHGHYHDASGREIPR